MKRNVFLILLMWSAITLIAQTGEIRVNITGIQVKKAGTIKVAVFKKEGFPKFGSQIAYKILEVKEPNSSVLIEGVSPGVYAIAAFQDINSDNVITRNFVGAPIEPYGFSKNIIGKAGPPDFNDVSFKLESGKRITLDIKLQ